MKPKPRSQNRRGDPAGSPTDRRERRKRWVQRGRYAVEVEIDVIYPADDPSEPCLEPATVRLLDEVARRAEAGDLPYLESVGRVFELVEKA
jgi:hypothetical protein